MKVTLDDQTSARKVVRIEVPSERVMSEYNEVLKEYASRARLPGFRPGKTPPGIIERKFLKSILQETRDRLVPRCYREAVEQQKLKPLAVISVSDAPVEKGAPLSFQVTIDVEPEFAMPEYKGIALQRRAVEVSDADVTQALDNTRERMAVFEDVAGRVAVEGDLVQVSYTGACDGAQMDQIQKDPASIARAEKMWVHIGRAELIPGLAAGLVGLAAGQKRDIAVTFPADSPFEALRGRTALYAVEVHLIREKKLPDDASLLQKLEAPSIEALRERYRTDLRRFRESEERERLRQELVRTLTERVDTALPESVIAAEQRSLIQNYVNSSIMNGVPKEQIASQKDAIMNAAASSSVQRVKSAYILNRIADAENVTVSDEEISARIAALGARYGLTEERMRARLAKEEALDDIGRNLRYEKTLDFLLDQARYTEV